VKGGGGSAHQTGLFFHHDGMYARHWRLPLCVNSVVTAVFKEHLQKVIFSVEMKHFILLSLSMHCIYHFFWSLSLVNFCNACILYILLTHGPYAFRLKTAL
jgi:hypothetical protein